MAAPEEGLVGLYFALKDRMRVLEPMLRDFYAELMRQLGLLDLLTLTLDGKEQKLTEELLQSVITAPDVPAALPSAAKAKMFSDDFRLFRGAYIRLFEDGSAFQKIMYRIFDRLGEAKIIWIRWKSEYRLNNKSNPKLRAFYRYMDASFVSQLPPGPYMSFTVDTLLYCEWRISHPNMIGFHLVMLTWMLNVREFQQFIPPYMTSTTPITDPLLKLFWPLSGLRISLPDQQGKSQRPAAASAKTTGGQESNKQQAAAAKAPREGL